MICKLCLSLLLLVPLVASAKSVAPYLKRKNVYAVPEGYVTAAFNNLADVLQTARAVPYYSADGKFGGFEISVIDKQSELRKLGLLPGDVMVKVNDVELDNAAKGLEAFQEVRDENVVKLQLLRKQKKLFLTYEKVK